MKRPEDIGALIAVEKGVKPAMVRKAMLKESEKVKKRPAALFHATALHNFESIKENGILPHAFYGNSYFCETIEHCLHFVKGPSVVFEVDPKQLDIKKLCYSQDHNKLIYNFDAFTYYKKVFPNAIKNWSVFK